MPSPGFVAGVVAGIIAGLVGGTALLRRSSEPATDRVGFVPGVPGPSKPGPIEAIAKRLQDAIDEGRVAAAEREADLQEQLARERAMPAFGGPEPVEMMSPAPPPSAIPATPPAATPPSPGPPPSTPPPGS